MESNCRIDTLGTERLSDLGKAFKFAASHISLLCSPRNRSILENQPEAEKVCLPVGSSDVSSIFLVSLMHSCHQGVGWNSAKLTKLHSDGKPLC